jgi:ribulose-5-phosphate 4-epimerase/fuculose-1-phosphate aldolase
VEVSSPGALEIKQQLAEAIRMLERAEIIDHSGHGSARRGRESFFINSGSSPRRTLTADDIVAVDLDGGLVEGNARPPLEFPLHAEIYRARADVQAIMHTHPRWSTLLTMVGADYKVVYGQGALLANVPVFGSPLSVTTREIGQRVAAVLDRGAAVLLKSHGAVVVGTNVVECFALTAYLEENASRQYLAMQIGAPYVFSDAEQQAFRERLATPALFRKTWDHYRSKL